MPQVNLRVKKKGNQIQRLKAASTRKKGIAEKKDKKNKKNKTSKKERKKERKDENNTAMSKKLSFKIHIT